MKYRKPRTINTVTILLLLIVAFGGYLLVYLWPVYSASAKVRSLLHDQIPALYRANLLSSGTSHPMIEVIKGDILDRMTKQGINPKTVQIEITHDSKQLSIQARFKAIAHFPYPDRTFEFNLSPKVQSDATRVDWN